MPAYLDVPPEKLGSGTPVHVRVVGDMASLAQDMARGDARRKSSRAANSGKPATLIVPVGPVDQFPILAEMINKQRLDCRDVMLINMDEYLTDDDRWIDAGHPLSFRGYMDRLFYDRLDPELAPKTRESRSFPIRKTASEIRQTDRKPRRRWTSALAGSGSMATSRSTSRRSRARR